MRWIYKKISFNMENCSPNANNTTDVHTFCTYCHVCTIDTAIVASRHTEQKQLEQIRCYLTPETCDNRNSKVKHSLPQMYNIDGSNSMVVNRRPSNFKNVLCASPHTIGVHSYQNINSVMINTFQITPSLFKVLLLTALDINNCTTQNTMDGVTVPSRHTEQQHFEQRRYKQFIDLFPPMTVQE
nr:hypothetical protein [Tanacetum cinerariifolium]